MQEATNEARRHLVAPTAVAATMLIGAGQQSTLNDPLSEVVGFAITPLRLDGRIDVTLDH
jgi:hypothetical protein